MDFCEIGEAVELVHVGRLTVDPTQEVRLMGHG